MCAHQSVYAMEMLEFAFMRCTYGVDSVLRSQSRSRQCLAITVDARLSGCAVGGCQGGMTSEFEGSSGALAGLLEGLKGALTSQMQWQKTVVEILKGNLDATVSKLKGVVDTANPVEVDAQVR